MRIRSLRIQGWRGFGQLELDLDPRITVLTGTNNSGKSSLLDALTVLLDSATPHPTSRPESPTSVRTPSPLVTPTEPTTAAAATDPAPHIDDRLIGRVEFDSGDVVDLLPAEPSADGLPVPRPAVAVPGVFITMNGTAPSVGSKLRSGDRDEDSDTWMSREEVATFVPSRRPGSAVCGRSWAPCGTCIG